MSECVIDKFGTYLNELSDACEEEENVYYTQYFREMDIIASKPGQCWAAHGSRQCTNIVGQSYAFCAWR